MLRVSFTLFNLQGARRFSAGLSLYHSAFHLSRTFSSFLTFLSRLSAQSVASVSRELVYFIITHSLCQALFSIFLKFPFKIFSIQCPAHRRSINIPKPRPFVNTFFRVFSDFFFATISSVYIGNSGTRCARLYGLFF